MEERRSRSMAAAAGLLRLAVVAVAAVVAGGDVAAGRQMVPAMYVFGDSLVDVGNNDFLPPPAPRPPEPPCGIDLPLEAAADEVAGGRSGRFTNGYNLADIIAQHVGFKMSPLAYLSLTTPGRRSNLRRGIVGANYASSGSGILDFIGNGTISLGEQVKLFADTKAMMVAAGEVNGERINHLLSQSLFITCTGGNDYNAFTDGIVPVSDAPAFIAHMVTTYIEHIKTLYKLGARRLGILDVLPLGCLPISRVPMENGECSGEDNWQARLFNRLLRRKMAAAVTASMPDLKYSIGSIYYTYYDMIVDPTLAGMKEVARACCGDGKLNAEADCSASANLCQDRNDYVFWDKVHGTQAAYQQCVHGFFHGSLRYAEPISFTQLVTSSAVDLARSSLSMNRTAVI
uniref:GDSL esterase/lipase n=1 Tax=Leersia perrieri TaxID=77586 RepID=A0A0D9Y0I1_9ORYZ